MEQFIEQVIMRSLTAFFIFLMFANVGLYTFWDTYKPRWFGQPCDFCKSFWVSVAVYFLPPHNYFNMNVFQLSSTAALTYLLILLTARWR